MHGPGRRPVSYTHLVEDLEDDADEEKTDRKGSFAGSVLLSKAEWDKEQLIRNLREEWGIVDEEPDDGDEDDENSDDAEMCIRDRVAKA